MNRERSTESERQPPCFRVIHVTADLRQVGPVVGTGVKVDPELTEPHDFVEKEPSKLSCKRSSAGPGKGPIQVTSVGKVPRLGYEAEDVYNRDSDNSSG
jgi:hypothetical protein